MPSMVLRKRYIIAGVALLGRTCYAIIRMYYGFVAAEKAGPVVDTAAFIAMSNKPLFSKVFLAGFRPPLVPLVYTILGSTTVSW